LSTDIESRPSSSRRERAAVVSAGRLGYEYLDDEIVGELTMRVLTPDEIADLLATMHAQSPGERRMKRQAQEYVNVRDSARREDAAQAPQIDAVRRTYETAKAIVELQRNALTTALPALAHQPDLAAETELVIADWCEAPASRAGAASEQIEELKRARDNVLSYAFRCNAMIDKVVAALGTEHPSSDELLEAKQLLSGEPRGSRAARTSDRF
jgi:hypothetical protein